MYRLHKKDPQVYTVEKLAKDYRIMRQGVLAILWLKDLEEEEEKKLGHPLDDSVELLLDNSLNSLIPMIGSSMLHPFLTNPTLRLCLRGEMALPKIGTKFIMKSPKRKMTSSIENLLRS